MRVLTVRQPWAGAIVHGGKDVENRTRNIAGAYRGPVAIHAGLSYDFDAVLMPPPLFAPIPVDEDGRYLRPRGAIIGVVDLVDVHNAVECWRKPWKHQDDGCCSDWAERSDEHDVFHLVLANPRPLGEPIPFRGALGLRTLPDEVEALVWAGARGGD